MRSRVMAMAAVTALLLLAGCGGQTPEAADAQSSATATPSSPLTAGPSTGSPSTEPTASPRPTPTSSAIAPDSEDSSTGFLLNVRHAPEFTDQSDQDLVATGRQVCDDLDGGATYDEVVAPLLEQGVSPDSAMVMAATAVFEFCGQHDPIIEVAMGGPASPEPDPVGDPRDGYLAAMRADTFFETSDDSLLLLMGTTYCDGFTRGDSLATTLGYTEAMPRESAMVMLTAATQVASSRVVYEASTVSASS